jgi:ribosomal protein S18 acetylase RimI-like enzyme
MILRDALPDDAAALAELGRASFCAAFEHLYAPADLSAFLEQVYTPAAVAEEIADPAIFHQLAADEVSGALTGFIKLKHPGGYPGYSDAANPITLAQLYTAPGRTGEGIGAALMDWALGQARARGCDAVQLSVWSENFGAQRFYQRYGFAHIADIDFYVGNHRDDEFLYELRL